MKILLLNPRIDAGHQILNALRERDAVLLMPENALEAWQMLQLHGTSIDLAIVHREDDGMSFVSKVKADTAQADLPLIISSETWGDAEFAQHQETTEGANAYLKWPFTAEQLLDTMDTMFGSGQTTRVTEMIQLSDYQPNAPEPRTVGTIGTVGTMGATEMIQPQDYISQSEDKKPSPPSESPAPAPVEEAIQLSATENSGHTIYLSTDDALEESMPKPKLVENESSVSFGGLGTLDVPTGASTLTPPAELMIELPDSLPPLSPEPEGNHGFEDQLEVTPLLSEAPKELSRTVPVPADTIGLTPTASIPRTSISIPTEPPASEDPEAAQEMPYLFKKEQKAKPEGLDPALFFNQPIGDAVVPGGAVHSPDSETLKKYLLLREQDVAALSSQLKAAKDQIAEIEEHFREERGKNVELTHALSERQKRIDAFELEKAQALESLQTEINELKFQLKTKTDKARILEAQVREATEEMEKLKERVRADIRKIRVREKELENRLEITRKDSEVLIGARENKIIELKRKLDLLEFNVDLLQDQYSREKDRSSKLRERLLKAAQVVRVAGGVLDTPGDTQPDFDPNQEAS